MKFLFSVVLLSFARLASAGSYIGDGLVDKLEYGPVYGNTVYISISGDHSQKPSCSINGSYNFVLDISTDIGKAVFSGLLSAHMSKSPVVVSGTNSCSISSEVENLRWLSLR